MTEWGAAGFSDEQLLDARIVLCEKLIEDYRAALLVRVPFDFIPCIYERAAEEIHRLGRLRDRLSAERKRGLGDGGCASRPVGEVPCERAA